MIIDYAFSSILVPNPNMICPTRTMLVLKTYVPYQVMPCPVTTKIASITIHVFCPCLSASIPPINGQKRLISCIEEVEKNPAITTKIIMDIPNTSRNLFTAGLVNL